MDACPDDPKCLLYTTTENDGHEYVSCKASKEEDQKHCQAYNDEFRKITDDGSVHAQIKRILLELICVT